MDHWLSEVSKLRQDMIAKIKKKRFNSRQQKVDSTFAATTYIEVYSL